MPFHMRRSVGHEPGMRKRTIWVVVVICVMLVAPMLSAMEGAGKGRDGHYRSSLKATAEDYGDWSPAPGTGGGSAAPIPHSAGPCSGDCLRYEASPSGYNASNSKG